MLRLIRLCLILTLVIAPAAQAKEVRLGRDVVPTSQDIELDLDASRTDYSGRVRIELDVRKDADRFAFHAQEMAFDRVTMTGKKGEVALDLNRGEGGYVSAKPFEKLKKGKYTLEIEFSKPYNTQAVGLYRMENDCVGYLALVLDPAFHGHRSSLPVSV